MTYQIFEMIPDTKTVYTLEQCESPRRYNSLSEAEDYIKQNVEKFEDKKITILPVLTIGL